MQIVNAVCRYMLTCHFDNIGFYFFDKKLG